MPSDSRECEGSGRKGRQVLDNPRRVQCNFCLQTFIRQAKRGYWLPFHDSYGSRSTTVSERPNSDGGEVR